MVDRVGYKLTSFTEKEIVEEFDDLYHLMDYLSRSGLSFAGNNKRETVLKDLFLATAALYKSFYGKEFEATEYERSSRRSPDNMRQEDVQKLAGKHVVPATFHLVQMMGWKDDPEKQPQPKKRGSGGGLDQFVKEIIDDDPSVADRIKHGVIKDDTFRPSTEAPLQSVGSSKKPSASSEDKPQSPFK